jgi:CRISPR/Cas system endoribonuclease Cas6 (RAMP superfamily)
VDELRCSGRSKYLQWDSFIDNTSMYSESRATVVYRTYRMAELVDSDQKPPPFSFFLLSVYIFIFNKKHLSFHLFDLYLTCSSPYIHALVW